MVSRDKSHSAYIPHSKETQVKILIGLFLIFIHTQCLKAEAACFVWQDAKAVSQAKGFTPKGASASFNEINGECPPYSDLDFIEEVDEMGEPVKRIELNETKRQARLDAEAAREAESNSRAEEARSRREAFRQNLKTFNWNGAPAAQIRDLLKAYFEAEGMETQ